MDVYDEIPLDRIRPDPGQPRHEFTDIERLAESIFHCGLLQVPVVRRGRGGEEDSDFFYLVAGERRWRALLWLANDGRWLSGKVFCLVKGEMTRSARVLAALAENDGRQDIPFWRAGYKYRELMDLGFTQLEIAARVSRPESHITACVLIAAGLHPDIVVRLDKIPDYLYRTQCLQLSRLLNEDYEPDLEAQSKLLDQFLIPGVKTKRPATKRRTPADKDRFFARFIKLKHGAVYVPAEFREAVKSIVDWIEGRASRITESTQ
jgi:ParB/RepB/Spo0J family partition protein